MHECVHDFNDAAGKDGAHFNDFKSLMTSCFIQISLIICYQINDGEEKGAVE